ncbi:MAG: sigma-70 family RNA polymerase sigma factor [Pirellulaceae bacterium]
MSSTAHNVAAAGQPRNASAESDEPFGSSASMWPLEAFRRQPVLEDYGGMRFFVNSHSAALKHNCLPFVYVVVSRTNGATEMDLLSQLEILKPRIVSLCQRWHEGEDLYQDVWLRCRVSCWREDWSVPQTALIMTIATNIVRDWHRRKTRQLKAFERLAVEIRASNRDAETDSVEQNEERQLLNARIQELPNRYRDCVKALLSFSGTTKAVAASLGLHPATFRTRTCRARRMLRDELSKLAS